MSTPVKVVLVEDSVIALQILQRLLDSSPDVNVVGTAQNGAEGLKVIAQTMPDVICTDLQMPQMDGFEFTKKVMADFPRPILVVSNVVHPSEIDNIFNLMQAGAKDFFPKPASGSAADYEQLQSTLITKIKVLANKNEVAVKNNAQLPGQQAMYENKPIQTSPTQPTMMYRGKPIQTSPIQQAKPSNNGQPKASKRQIRYRGRLIDAE